LRTALATMVAFAALAAPAFAADPQTNLADIEDEVMCPICGTTLELSDSPQAEREREFIREQIADGRSKDEVKDALVAEYGEDVLALPDADGFDLAAWVVPALVILLGALGVGVAIARLARRRDGEAPGEDLDPADAARLDRDISGYDL
jgi:cytochrome c-type biogenesis protein CcmH